MIIGITGSSGAGKSTVCEILKNEYDAIILNADKIAKQLSKNGTEYFKSIVKEFGTEILLNNGELNRPKLASIIYNDDKKRQILNKYTFKYVKQEVEKLIKDIETKSQENCNSKGEQIIAIDAPLLFEAKLEQMCNTVIAVISENREIQIERIIKRDGINRKQAIERLNAQNNNEFYTSRSNYVIINDSELEGIGEQIKKIYQQMYKF